MGLEKVGDRTVRPHVGEIAARKSLADLNAVSEYIEFQRQVLHRRQARRRGHDCSQCFQIARVTSPGLQRNLHLQALENQIEREAAVVPPQCSMLQLKAAHRKINQILGD